MAKDYYFNISFGKLHATLEEQILIKLNCNISV